jgi:hypothetical protein
MIFRRAKRGIPVPSPVSPPVPSPVSPPVTVTAAEGREIQKTYLNLIAARDAAEAYSARCGLQPFSDLQGPPEQAMRRPG